MQLIKRETDHHHEIIHVGNGTGDHREDRDYPVEMMMMMSGHHHHHHHILHETAYEKVRRLASGNAVVVFSLSECCMCHVVKRLLFGLGVGPTIIELDEQDDEEKTALGPVGGGDGGGREMLGVLYQLISGSSFGGGGGGEPVQQQQLLQQYQKMAVPAVFVGGKFLGGVQTVMSCHINGTLVPLLKSAGALWL